MRSMRYRWVALMAAPFWLVGCTEDADLPVPDGAQVESYYTVEAEIEAEVSGNVATLTVYQPYDQLRRGGTLWAKVGPYVFLFSEPTQRLFQDFGGLAAVRVVTRDPSGNEVARASLQRNTLNQVTWRRALNISGRVRRDGTMRPSLLEELIRWGEDRTEFAYSPRYTRSR